MTLIYFKGCPNAQPMRKMLLQAGVEEIEEWIQDELPPGHRFLGYSSPTVMRGESLLFGTRTDAAQGGCSLSLPNLEELRELLA